MVVNKQKSNNSTKFGKIRGTKQRKFCFVICFWSMSFTKCQLSGFLSFKLFFKQKCLPFLGFSFYFVQMCWFSLFYVVINWVSSGSVGHWVSGNCSIFLKFYRPNNFLIYVENNLHVKQNLFVCFYSKTKIKCESFKGSGVVADCH